MTMAEYIDREAAMQSVEYVPLLRPNDDDIIAAALAAAREHISRVPAADVAPVVHAHWERQWDGKRSTGYKCSNPKCGVLSCCKGTFCPNCGAKMDGMVER